MRSCLRVGIAVCLFARLVLGQPQEQTDAAKPKNQSLFEALRQGQASKVRTVIDQGVDVNIRDGGIPS